MRLGSLAAVVVACLAGTSGRAAPREIDRFLGEPIVEVQIVSDGVRVASAAVAELVETRVGEPLSLRQVRESLTHLYSLGGYGGIGLSPKVAPAELLGRRRGRAGPEAAKGGPGVIGHRQPAVSRRRPQRFDVHTDEQREHR